MFAMSPLFLAFPFVGSGSITDPYFYSVVLLLQCDGVNGSTTFTDVSPFPKTVTPIGGTSISTSQSQFGGASVSLGSPYGLNTSSSADFAFGGDFTAEFWVYMTTVTTDQFFLDTNGTAYGFGLELYSPPTNTLQFYCNTTTILSTTAWTPVANTWYHCALVRSNGTVSFYVNGTSIVSNVYTGVINLPSYGMRIGQYGTTPLLYGINGYMDEIRISKMARYTANFTPPTAAFPTSGPQSPDPVGIPGSILWLDADDATTLTLGTTDVISWADKSGSKLVFSQASSGLRPVINTTFFTKNSVDFGTSAAKWLASTAALTIPGPTTIFMVVYWAITGLTYKALALQNGHASNAVSTNASPYILAYTATTQGPEFEISASSPSYYVYQNVPASSQGVGSVITAAVNSTIASSVIRKNGVGLSQASTGTPRTITIDTVGASDTTYTPNGAFAEILIYNSTLTTTQMQAVESYLRTKWGTP